MRVFLSTADASGDLHAAGFLRALRAREEGVEAFGLGGAALEAAGLEAVVPQSAVAVAGLVEVLSSAPRLVAAYGRLRGSLRRARPDLAVFVDSPDLNLPLASVAHRAGIPVLYYVVPQFWAWRGGRVRKLRRRVDHAAVLFPFEEEMLRAAGVPATCVGHPLVERLAAFQRDFRAKEFAREAGLDESRPVLGLLPGSRRNEVAANLPLFLEAARIVCDAMPGVQPVIAVAPTLRGEGLELPAGVRAVESAAHELLSLSTCALVAPGTASLEATILGTPLVVVHRVHPISYAVACRVVRVPSSCMANLLAEEGIVSERLQAYARPVSVAGLALRLLRSEEQRARLRAALGRAVSRLGGPGASDRCAELALRLTQR